MTGIDGCPLGWLAVTIDTATNGFAVEAYRTFAAAVGGVSTSAVVAVDIPIGLHESQPRQADLAARRFLSRRGSSVFPAPCRAALAGDTYAGASALSYEASGKKLTKQTFAILGKIREVDSALRSDVVISTQVVEVHPEVCFAVLNGGMPLNHPKKRTAGRQERLELLPPEYRAAFEGARPRWHHKEVASDDILDALVAAWTADRVHRRAARSFPDHVTEFDATGLPMRILA